MSTTTSTDSRDLRPLTRFEREYPVDDEGNEIGLGDSVRATSALDGKNEDGDRSRVGRVVAIGGRGRPRNAITVRFVDGVELGSAAALWRRVREGVAEPAVMRRGRPRK